MGMSEEDGAAPGDDRLTLQWKSRQVPVGVETVWDPDARRAR